MNFNNMTNGKFDLTILIDILKVRGRRWYRVSQKNAPMLAHFPSKMANMGAFSVAKATLEVQMSVRLSVINQNPKTA